MTSLPTLRRAGIAIAFVLTGGCSMAMGVTPVGTTAAATVADAQRLPFVGAWKLVRQEGRNLQSGELVPSQTSDAWPRLLVYTPDGWMNVTIDRRPTGGTYWGYFGTFSVAGDTIVHNIAGGVPSGRGPSPALYRFENDGRQLVISTLPGPNAVVVHYSFERAR